MTPEKTKRAFHACAQLIRHHAPGLSAAPRRMPSEETGMGASRRLEHILWMCDEGVKLVEEKRTEKAMRWLGFIQGAMWIDLDITIEDMKHINMPDPVCAFCKKNPPAYPGAVYCGAACTARAEGGEVSPEGQIE